MIRFGGTHVARSAAVYLGLGLVSALRMNAQVELKAVGRDHISIVINGQPFSDFYIGSSYAKPFLAPLRSATGLVATRKYPLETVEGESRDHPHHRGLWIGFGSINGVNFWETEPESKPSPENPAAKGAVVLQNLDRVVSGKKSGTISATFEWRAPDGQNMIEEQRNMTFYADREIRRIDIDAIFTAKVNLKFEDTKEGFFAIRVADSMAGKNGGLMTNSEGDQTEKNVWGKRADWVDYDGTVDGQKIGIVIFDHPQNYNHPPRWHSRDYGLFAVNPFGLKEFNPKSTGIGGRSMSAGEAMRFRYRVIIHPGDVPKKKIADWYSEFSKQE